MTQTLPQHVKNPLTGSEYAPRGTDCDCPECEDRFPVPRLATTQLDRAGMRRIQAELRPAKDEDRIEDVEYWLRKVLDRVTDRGEEYLALYRNDTGPLADALLDAENACEDVLYEYRQAWEQAQARKSDFMCDDRR